MATRIKKTLPSTTASREFVYEPGVPIDPLSKPSLCTQIMDGQAKGPAGFMAIGLADPGREYVNFEKNPSLLRIVPDPELARKKIIKISYYSGSAYGWREITVPFVYPVITADHENAPHCVRPTDPGQEDAKKKSRAAHLPKFQKTKPDPEPAPADGKRVFKGKLYGKNVLFDAGDGSTIATLEAGTPIKEGADKVKRTVVSQGDASAYAIFVFTKQWNAQK